MRYRDTAGGKNTAIHRLNITYAGREVGPCFAFRAASYFPVMLYKCWTVRSGKLKHPSGSPTSSSLSDEGGGNLRRAPRSRNSHKGLFGCDGRVGSFPAFFYSSRYIHQAALATSLLILLFELMGTRWRRRVEFSSFTCRPIVPADLMNQTCRSQKVLVSFWRLILSDFQICALIEKRSLGLS